MATRYHYCKYETFKKIICNNTLRLSDIRKSNDLYEMNLFLKQHEGIGCISEYVENKDDGFWRNLEEYITYVTDYTECFASCLSIGSDRLSQWERYGDKCKGLAIGFNEEKLQEYIEKVAETIKEYNADNDCVNFSKIIAKKVNYKKLLSISYPFEVAQKFNDFMYLEECSFTKHIGFKEEKEFRIALIFSKGKTDFLESSLSEYIGETVVNESTKTNYIDLKFPKEIIEEIYIGPLNSTSEEIIKKELKNNNVYCKVKKSTIPYNPYRSNMKNKINNS